MHVQHATYGHKTSLQRTRFVFPNDLACLQATSALAIFRDSLCPTAGGCTSTRPAVAWLRQDPSWQDARRYRTWSDRCVTRSAAPRAEAASRDSTGLPFVADMYGLQLDQLAVLLGVTHRQARAVITRWTNRKLAESAVLSQGPPWVWLTRTGLQACGVRYAPAPPALARLAHIRAVTAVRLALEAVPSYRSGGAHWRSERHLRARLGGRLGSRDHLPDAEVHWPDSVLGGGRPAAWAGECWAIEAELTPKTVSRTTAIMRGLLARTGDYGCPAAEALVSGLPPRHARAIYLCSHPAASTVERARDALGSLGTRIEIRGLPESAYLPARMPA
jgi:hypothetical protein